MRLVSTFFVIFSLVACTKEPDSILVKLPAEAPKAMRKHPVAPVLKKKGETLALRASSFDKDGNYMGQAPVTWVSTNQEVAEVDGNGLVTAKGSGVSQITAMTTGYSKDLTSTLDVKVEIVGSVKIIPPAPNFSRIRIGKTAMLKAEVKDDSGKPMPEARVIWPKPDPHTVWLTPRGQDAEIEGAAIGMTTLHAESGDVIADFEVETIE